MKFRVHGLVPVAMAVLLAGGVHAQTATDDSAAPPSQEAMEAAMTLPQAFAERAASSNMFEIQSSELAVQMSQSDEVRTFAEKMIADHQAAGEKMLVAATAEGVSPPQALMPDHQAQLDSLAAMTGEEFDTAYLAAQAAAHNDAVTLFEGYSTQGTEGDLKAFATETLPTLQSHMQEVKPLAAE